LQEAFEKGKSKLFNELATLQKRAECSENQADKKAKWSEFKGHAKELKPHARYSNEIEKEKNEAMQIRQLSPLQASKVEHPWKN